MIIKCKQREQYPICDITPEHTKRDTGDNEPLHSDINQAYKYVESVIKCSDYVDPYAWHGWAIREAFLAGISYAENEKARVA